MGNEEPINDYIMEIVEKGIELFQIKGGLIPYREHYNEFKEYVYSVYSYNYDIHKLDRFPEEVQIEYAKSYAAYLATKILFSEFIRELPLENLYYLPAVIKDYFDEVENEYKRLMKQGGDNIDISFN